MHTSMGTHMQLLHVVQIIHTSLRQVAYGVRIVYKIAD